MQNEGNSSAPPDKRPSLGNLLREIPSKCSHTSMYAPLFRKFFAKPCLKSGRFLQNLTPPELLQMTGREGERRDSILP